MSEDIVYFCSLAYTENIGDGVPLSYTSANSLENTSRVGSRVGKLFFSKPYVFGDEIIYLSQLKGG